jgi:hypothetical protein
MCIVDLITQTTLYFTINLLPTHNLIWAAIVHILQKFTPLLFFATVDIWFARMWTSSKLRTLKHSWASIILRFFHNHLIWIFVYCSIALLAILFTVDVVVDKFLPTVHNWIISLSVIFIDFALLGIGVLFGLDVLYKLSNLTFQHKAVQIVGRMKWMFPIWTIWKIVHMILTTLMIARVANWYIYFPFTRNPNRNVNWQTMVWFIIVSFRAVSNDKTPLLMTPIAYAGYDPTNTSESPVEEPEDDDEYLGGTTEDESELSIYEVNVIGSLRKKPELTPKFPIKEKERKSITFNPVVEVVDVKRKLFQ